MSLAVGEDLAPRTVEIDRDMITAYAQASGDLNPIHLDPAFARSVGLPGVIAHGMLQMGLLATYVSDWAGGGERVRRLRCRFSGMVQPGDALTFGGRVTGVEAGAASLELWATNQRGEKILTKGEAAVLL